MKCPYCDATDSRVIDSRDSVAGIRRRRECLACGVRFTTYERVQTAALTVSKRDGRFEEFNNEKLLRSIRIACAKRPLPTGSVERIAEEIEARLQELGRAEVPAPAIGEMVIRRLKELDRVAYIRFASVYRDFADIDTFKEEIEALLKARDVARTHISQSQLSLISLDDSLRPPARRRGRRLKVPPQSKILDLDEARKHRGA